jgi:hypothetical protein
VTAELAVIVAHDDDTDAPVALWAPCDRTSIRYMSREYARQLTDDTRRLLTEAGANLVELRDGSAHVVLGYAHWHEYVEREFGDLAVYKLVRDRQQRVAERDALIASMTIAGYTVREQRDAIGASVGTVHETQRRLGLVPDRPIVDVDPEPPAPDPFRGLTRTHESLARVAAQGERGLTSLELDSETGWPLGTATGLLSRLERGRGGRGGGLIAFGDAPLRQRRLPYVLTDRGRALLDEVLAARDAAEQPAPVD